MYQLIYIPEAYIMKTTETQAEMADYIRTLLPYRFHSHLFYTSGKTFILDTATQNEVRLDQIGL
jgi:hypothetical protein